MELKHIATRAGRLSSFLRGELQLSSGLMNRLKWQQQLFVNGNPVHTDFAVSMGDVITVPLDEPDPDYPAEDGALHILYEDEYLLAVDKPAGMLIHPSHTRYTGTLANLVVGYYKKTGQRSAFHPMTRLDRDTFGVVLLAKNAHIHNLLSEQNSLQKVYHAWVFGVPDTPTGTIVAPIARLPLPSLLRQVQADGKPSVTEYTVLEKRDPICKLALRPITGRTHQLRVHCAYMGFPILGDPQYGTVDSQQFSHQLGLTSQLLCAKELTFVHPITRQVVELSSDLEGEIPCF